jgi:hypothetical protein
MTAKMKRREFITLLGGAVSLISLLKGSHESCAGLH